MKVTIKSAEEIEKMRRAGEILAAVHQNLAREIKPGMSTLDIDRLGEEMIRGYGCIPSFKNYCGYPASICVSVNEEVVHGIPTDERIIKEGDIVSLDAGVIYEGYHSDAARTVAVGEVSEEAKLLIERTRQSFIEGMKKAVAGNHLYDISAAIGDYANQFGYGVVEDLCGHGIGSHLHEEPEIPNFRQSRFRRGIKLKPGMTLAVEPMINVGTKDVLWMDDEWTVVTEDKSLSAHYENTILITDGKPEILSLTEEDLCGHGIGSHLHEEPEIPNFRQSRFRRGIKLKPGMTLAVEPMINVGTKDVLWMDDEWTVVTEDKSLSAHYENTILITDGKPEILSLTEEEKKAGFLNLF